MKVMLNGNYYGTAPRLTVLIITRYSVRVLSISTRWYSYARTLFAYARTLLALVALVKLNADHNFSLSQPLPACQGWGELSIYKSSVITPISSLRNIKPSIQQYKSRDLIPVIMDTIMTSVFPLPNIDYLGSF